MQDPTLSYEPADHVPKPRHALAAWAIFAGLIVAALGAGSDHAVSLGDDRHAALSAQPDGEIRSGPAPLHNRCA